MLSMQEMNFGKHCKNLNRVFLYGFFQTRTMLLDGKIYIEDVTKDINQ